MVDPKQSIRVATALLGRFRAIMDGARGMPTMSTLELMIGESDQIYPEIWRHLDDAAHELRARGRDLHEFDASRKDELVQLGVTNVEVTHRIDYAALLLGHHARRTVKTASFNAGGYQRAKAACEALMRAMPEIHWAEVDRAEDREIAAVGSLHTRRWRAMALWLGLAAAVAAVVIGVYAFVTRVPPEEPAPRTRRQAKEDLAGEQRARAEIVLDQQIDELRAAYHRTCDRTELPELLQLLRDRGRAAEARAVETEVCRPLRPTCDGVRDALEARLATQLGFGPADVTLTCEGVLIGQPLVPALAVVITGHAGGAAPETMRAITSADGTRDLVALAPAPGRTLVGVGDLDQDGSDELVMIGTTTLVVTQVSPDALVDLPGPALATGCSANANVERDFRNGRPGSRKLLVITVDDPAPRKGCPAEGRHYYELRDAAIVELP